MVRYMLNFSIRNSYKTNIIFQKDYKISSLIINSLRFRTFYCLLSVYYLSYYLFIILRINLLKFMLNLIKCFILPFENTKNKHKRSSVNNEVDANDNFI